jgi:hypothetical protein
MYNSSIFESIKEALANSQKGSGGSSMYKEVLKFKPGNTYILRLLPNIKDPNKTFYKFYQHGWESFCTGEYVSVLSLQTIGKPDPISLATWRIKKHGTPEEKAKAEQVKWSEQVYVNAYVVDDPTNPENNGTVKIFRFGRKLKKLIESATTGEDAAEFGARVFDLGKNGVNFKLKAEKQGEYTTYDSSRFTSPTDLGLSEEKQKEIYDSIHDLESVNTIKSEEEILDMWQKHFVCDAASAKVEKTESRVTSTPSKLVEVDDEPTSTTDELSDEAVAELLKGFDN